MEKHSIYRASFIHLSKSLVDEPPSRFPSGAPMERDVYLQSLFYLSFRVSSKGALPPGSLHIAPIERNAPPLQPLSAIFQSPRQKSPLQVVQLSPSEERCPPSEPSFHNPGYPVKEPSLEVLRSETLQRETPHSSSPFIHLSKFPVDGPPPQDPNGAPIWRDTQPRTFFHT
jgi:hypothetical protein